MTITPSTEIEQFREFLSEQINQGGLSLTPEESVEAFRTYQRDLQRLHEELKPAIDRLDRHEPVELLNVEELKRRGRERLAHEGITD